LQRQDLHHRGFDLVDMEDAGHRPSAGVAVENQPARMILVDLGYRRDAQPLGRRECVATQTTAMLSRRLQANDPATARLRTALGRTNEGAAAGLALTIRLDRSPERVTHVAASAMANPAVLQDLQSAFGRSAAGRTPIAASRIAAGPLPLP